MALTLKQRLFVEAYMSNGGNATDAARAAGYKGDDVVLRSVGRENLTKPLIAAAIEARMGQLQAERGILSADDVLDIISRQAAGSMDDFTTADGRGVFLDLARAKKAGKFHLVKKYKKTDKGTEIELYDAQAAAQLLGKYHGLFTETINIQDRAADIVNGVVEDCVNVLREFMTDDDNLAKALDALESRLSARYGRDGRGPAPRTAPEAAVPEPAGVAR